MITLKSDILPPSDVMVEFLGGGLGIFTDRDLRSIFLGFEFQEPIFFGYWSQLLYFWGLLNKSCILKCFIFSNSIVLGLVLFIRYFSNHGSPLLSYHA